MGARIAFMAKCMGHVANMYGICGKLRALNQGMAEGFVFAARLLKQNKLVLSRPGSR